MRRGLVVRAVVVGGLAAAAGVYWFEPWKLFVDAKVEEAAPAIDGSTLKTVAEGRRFSVGFGAAPLDR